MRKLLTVFGALFVVLIVLVGIQWLIWYRSGMGFHGEMEAYLDEVVPEVLTKMDKGVLLDHACTEFTKKYKDGSFVDDYFALLKRLGKFRSIRERSGIVRLTFFNRGPVTADCKVKAEFDAGTPEFTVQLVRRSERWQIGSFMVDADTALRLQTTPNNSVQPTAVRSAASGG